VVEVEGGQTRGISQIEFQRKGRKITVFWSNIFSNFGEKPKQYST
jgi:hypothetical protein